MTQRITARADGVLLFEQQEMHDAGLPVPAELKYLVCNDSTLCYVQQGTAMLGVLAGSIEERDWKDGPFFPGARDALRPATPVDFRRFRVMLPPDFGRQQAERQQHE